MCILNLSLKEVSKLCYVRSKLTLLSTLYTIFAQS